jgi:dTDP-4-amino-4,6-dideoxygalactose transaminase
VTDRPALLGGTPVRAEPVPFVRPVLPPLDVLEPELRSMFESGILTKGRWLRRFEEAIAAHAGVPHAVAVSSCTAGLMMAVQQLDLRGDVLVPSFTFMATVHPLAWSGLRPVFVDVCRDTWNIDPQAAEEALTPQATAIVAVHIGGNPAPVEALQALAERHGLRLLYDAAHGFGALHRGRPLGSYGDAEVFSTSPTKLLITGEGGVITTGDAELAARLRMAREYGNRGDYDSVFPGLNARMQEFSAVLGWHSLQMLEAAARRRNAVAARYRTRLATLPGIGFQVVQPEDRSAYKDFTILVEPAEFGLTAVELALALKAEGIDTRRYYAPPVHRHTAYRELGRQFDGRLPVTDWLAERVLSLPIYSDMDDLLVDDICVAVERIHRHAAAVRRAVAEQHRRAPAMHAAVAEG